MRKLFVIVRGDAGLRLASAARETAGTEFAVEAVTFGSADIGALFAHGVHRVYSVTGADDEYGKAAALHSLCEKERPEIVLFPSTVEFCTVAPMTAALLHTGLTADCTSFSLTESGKLLQTRPALGGSVTADILCADAMPQMATVRENILPPVSELPPACGEVIAVHTELTPAVRILSSLPRAESAASLQEASVILSGGKGIGGREGFALLKKLAEAIPGARVGASRGAVSASYAPYECQVGLTGEIVRPKIYIAFGISGAVQHIAGMKDSGTVISVNTDARAPIFDYSDIAITAPWQEVAGQMLRLLTGESL